MAQGQDKTPEQHQAQGQNMAQGQDGPTKAAKANDPVLLALTQNRLDHISQQMGHVMVRTARSPIFSQAHDFSCFIAGPDGRVTAQADGIPIHTGGGGFAVRAVLRDHGGSIADGDVFLLNDPWQAGGNHLPDWVIARPVFVGGRLVSFVCNRAHQSDIGGGAAGTYNPEATEVWQEGVRLPVLKLVEAGTVRQDLWKLLMLNTRTPDLLEGDLGAMLGSTRIGAEQVAALVEEIGVDTAMDYFDGILAHAASRMSAAIAELPDGIYRGEDRSDNDCFELRDVWVRVSLTIGGGRAKVDFTGTDPQIRGFKNSTLANTHSAVFTAFASFFDPAIPRNEGTFSSLEIVAPEGTIVNATEGAATTMNTVFVAHEIIHAVWRALNQAAPDRACAGWAKNVFGVTSGREIGADGSTGKPYVFYHGLAAAGAGAVEGRDGFNQIGHLCTLGGLTISNVETYERLYPVRFVRQDLRCDGGGAGRWRGGTGADYEVEVMTPALYSFRGEGLRYQTGFGVAGGDWGAAGEMHVQETGSAPELAPKFGLRRLDAGRLSASSPGGGGWGRPEDRPVAEVWRDWRDGLISTEAARDAYAVVFSGDPDDPSSSLDTVDAEATRALRDKRRQTSPSAQGDVGPF
ncbi:hydantoinase B/oxoprolinase family protein [Thalassobaculum salexigens]|uniref:hydantoinase B/oxoprolinase family protein n=1 Tax=Thalassobaculum salexigens TaxID=455360 RepID=UPI001B7F7D21|nr:hydantoinase B/oxoprolinase family protein [Thalassobaculum salexigens]